MPCNSVNERPSFCNDDASSGQRKARREARRKARVSGGRALSAFLARSSASSALLSSWPLGVSPARARLRCRAGFLSGLRRSPGCFFPVRFVSIMVIDLRAPCWISHVRPAVFFKTRALRRRSLSMSATAIFWDRSKLSVSQARGNG